MVNISRKGKRWERQLSKLLNENFPGTWRRIPGSGAVGTILELPSLKGDVRGDYYFLSTPILGEAKSGYGEKQITLKKEWFDKIRAEAEESYSLPAVIFRYNAARTGVRYVIAFDFEAWDALMQEMESMHNEILRLYEIVEQYEPQETIRDDDATEIRRTKGFAD